MPPAARLTDAHTCPHAGGPVVTRGERTVIVGGQVAARVSDRCLCRAPEDVIVEGESSVLIGGERAARIGDATAHGGRVVQGEPTVLIGHNSATACLKQAAKERAALVKNTDAATRQAPARPAAQGGGGRAMDVDGAVAHLDAHAHATSQRRCARYVRQAIETGGGARLGSTLHARDYGPLLTRAGFSPVATQASLDAYVPRAGDVAVFQPAAGTSASGHMQMYNGSRWVSDFRQSSFYAGRSYRGADVTVYRP